MKLLCRLNDLADDAGPWLLLLIASPLVIPALLLAGTVVGIKALLERLPTAVIWTVGGAAVVGAIGWIGWPAVVLLAVLLGVVILLTTLKLIAILLDIL